MFNLLARERQILDRIPSSPAHFFRIQIAKTRPKGAQHGPNNTI